jgi:hypothetical protein
MFGSGCAPGKNHKNGDYFQAKKYFIPMGNVNIRIDHHYKILDDKGDK